jgi:hypothetical protein
MAASEVIQEKQRFGALYQDVVDAHGNQILADGVVLVHLECQLQLGADAVGAGNQHRLAIVFRQFHQRAEAADTAQHFRAQRAFGVGLDALHQGIAGIDIDAGIAV